MGRGHDSCISSRHLGNISTEDRFREVTGLAYKVGDQDSWIEMLAKERAPTISPQTSKYDPKSLFRDPTMETGLACIVYSICLSLLQSIILLQPQMPMFIRLNRSWDNFYNPEWYVTDSLTQYWKWLILVEDVCRFMVCSSVFYRHSVVRRCCEKSGALSCRGTIHLIENCVITRRYLGQITLSSIH